MNKVSVSVFYWYAFLTVLAAISSITINVRDLASGLVMLWIVFLFFFVGCNVKLYPYRSKPLVSEKISAKAIPLVFISLGALLASFYAAKFYTGKSFFDVLSALSSGKSLYNEYQLFFKLQGLAVLSVVKVPAILAMLYLKLSVIYCFIYIIALGKSSNFRGLVCISLVSFAQLFFSVARGTSFEIFELILLFWFCVSMRSVIFRSSRSVVNTYSVILLLFIIFSVLLYSYNISSRYSFKEIASCSTQELCFNTETFLYQVSKPLASLTYKLSGYFTFGIFYTSKFIEEFCIINSFNFTSVFLPFADIHRPDLNSDLMCGVALDCGASWVPDIVTYVLRVGIIFLLLLAFMFGLFTRYLLRVIVYKKRSMELFLLYFVFLGLVSLPVGNFIVASSANTLSLIVVILAFFCETIFKKLFSKRLRML